MYSRMFVYLVLLLLVTPSSTSTTTKFRKGCLVNRGTVLAGRSALNDPNHCLRLRCVRRGNTYTLGPKTLRGCKCNMAPPACPMCMISPGDKPVCGTDQITYPNLCALQAVAHPCGSKDVALLYIGRCGDCPRECMKSMWPICGSNGQTYGNMCQLMRSACTVPNLTPKYEGLCEIKKTKTKMCRVGSKKYRPGEVVMTLKNYCAQVTCDLDPRGRPVLTCTDLPHHPTCQCQGPRKR